MKNRYRIVTNGVIFRVQSRPAWWPFWAYMSEGWPPHILARATREEAEQIIAQLEADDRYRARPWRTVS